MSDNPTQETHDPRSFEERVFARFDALDSRLSPLENKVDGLGARLSSLEGKVDELNGRVATLEDKVDSRLRETRPIWEAMQADLTNVKGDVKEIKYVLKAMHKDNLRVRAEQVELDERVEKLESRPTR